MTASEKARKSWEREYIDALSQAAGIAYILGEKDAARVLHRLSVEALGMSTKRKTKPNNKAAP